ncbi:type II secretion system protein [Lentisphaera profundi]|uniref:Type II secretion system protein n=1 Tax=Lentisphaera profundi TaxID=1658616 RepID=A0ABY7VR48_9BACT|nr:type II secretion system protein [Lentisphaera profundi]WDE96680.1 type II secretion system protein [Lentisphaera profundi]
MKKKFTLIELLVSIAIIGILTSFLLPILGKSRKQARFTLCQSKIRQIGIATFAYSMDNNNYASYNNSHSTYYWTERLSTQSYLPEISASNSNVNSSPYKCPEGVELDTYYTSNYSQNFRLGLTSESGTAYDQYVLTSTHASSTVLHMDSFMTNTTLWKGNLTENKVFNADPEARVGRHLQKANTSFIDGHIEALNGTYLIQISTEASTTDFWVP